MTFTKLITVSSIIIFFTIFLGFRFFYALESDHGIYFSGSYYWFNSDLPFYEIVKDIKPPGYYLFLGSIGFLFDWNYFSAYIGYICSIFLFISSSALVFLKINKNINHLIVYLIITSTFMSFLSTNSGIALFQGGLLNIGLFFHIKIFNKEPHAMLYVILSYLFIGFAIISRIDSILIIPLLWFGILIFYNNYSFGKTIKYFFCALLGLLTPLVILFFLKISISEFIFYNFELAAIYKETYLSKIGFIYKPKVIDAMSGSALLFLIPVILYNAYLTVKENKNFSQLFGVAGLLFMICVYLWIGTDRIYHLLVIFPFLTIVFATACQNIINTQKSYRFLIIAPVLMVLLVFVQNLMPSAYSAYEKKQNIFSIPIEVIELEDYMSQNKIEDIVSGDIKAWFHVLKKDNNPKLSHFHNLYLFFNYDDAHVKNDLNKLLNTREKIFLIDIGLLDSKISTPIMVDIKSKTKTIGQYKDYYIQAVK